jgi:predicted RNase H-like HicB family nuclease
MEKIEVTVCKTDTGFSAHIEDLLGVITTGKTIYDVKINMYEAVEGHLSAMREDNDPIPESFQGEYELVFKMDVDSLLQL